MDHFYSLAVERDWRIAEREQARRDAIEREIESFRAQARSLLTQVNANAKDMRTIATELLGSGRTTATTLTGC
jgi:hypothetical protein